MSWKEMDGVERERVEGDESGMRSDMKGVECGEEKVVERKGRSERKGSGQEGKRRREEV